MNLEDTTTDHVHLDLTVNSSASNLSGNALISGHVLKDDTETAVFATNHLDIKRVWVNNGAEFVQLDSKISDSHAVFDSALSTLGKKHPYLFTQCQAIHARSFFPCQDNPSVKISYSASIRVPKPLTALMSAISTSSTDDGDFTVYSFEQKPAIPSYLVALVVGNLASAKISERCAVWSEPETIDACAWEFAEVETILQTAEDLITPYQWGRYDLLVLPPSFPFGGMENPCLTFVTPTLLAGDRSLTDVIAHEIAHSWSGNLTLRYRSLNNNVNLYGKNSPLTALVPDLDGIDPDGAFSRIPYEKGSLLTYHLEKLFDSVIWNHISKMYIRKFVGQSIGTGSFYDFLRKYVEYYLDNDAKKKLASVSWGAWFKGVRMPPVEFKFDEKPQQVAMELADRWWASRDSSDHSLEEFPLQQFSTLLMQQKATFLNSLKDKGSIPHAFLGSLDRIYGLSASHNCEVRFSWLMLALANSYEDTFASTVAMLSEQGRMKYTRPLYRAMAASGEKGKALTIEKFNTNRSSYHPICVRMVASDFGMQA
ncbi:Leucyl aminopeptidase yscIV [Coemansia sp. RSA 1933]|nr:Leucyl aminopeptidase yscIV [Coemansia sp. RSA 1933]